MITLCRAESFRLILEKGGVHSFEVGLRDEIWGEARVIFPKRSIMGTVVRLKWMT